MTVTFGFYGSVNGDRTYNAKQLGKIFDGIVSDGIYPSLGTELQVTPGTGLQVAVGIGRAFFKSTWTYNDASLLLSVDAPHASWNRIDAVVLEVNSDDAVRANSIKIIKGTPSASPQNPSLANTSTVRQYPLAYILVKVGASSFVVGDITNTIGSTACPYACFTTRASASDLLDPVKGNRESIVVTPKALRDSEMLPYVLPGSYGSFLQTTRDALAVYKWSSIPDDGWIPYDPLRTFTPLIDTSVVNTTLNVTSITIENSTTYYNRRAKLYTTRGSLGKYLYPLIVESSLGKEVSQYEGSGTGYITANHLLLDHNGGSNQKVTFLDLAPRLQVSDVSAKFIFAPGTRIRFTQDGVVKHFIVLANDGLDNPATLTIFRGVGGDLPTNVYLTASPITNLSYSYDRSPVGFPGPDNWGYSWSSAIELAGSISGSVNWLALNTLIRWPIPPGSWMLSCDLQVKNPTGAVGSILNSYSLCVVDDFGVYSSLLQDLMWDSTTIGTTGTDISIIKRMPIHLAAATMLGLAFKQSVATGGFGMNYPYDAGKRSVFRFSSLYY